MKYPENKSSYIYEIRLLIVYSWNVEFKVTLGNGPHVLYVLYMFVYFW